MQQLQKSKKTEIGEIPEEWTISRLACLCDSKPQYGAAISAIPKNVNLPRYIRITDLKDDGSLKPEEWKSITEKESKPYLMSEGQILFARTGATVGKTYLYRKEDGKCAFAGYLIRFIPNKTKLDPNFLFHYTHFKKYWEWLRSIQTEGVQPNVNAEQYGNMLLPNPPIREQQKIAMILSNVDELIQKTDQIIEQTQRLKKGLMQRLLTKGIEHAKFKKVKYNFGKIIEIPEEWESKRLGEVVKFRQGLQIAKVQRYKEPGKNRLKLIKVLDFHERKEDYNDEYIDIPPVSRQSVICGKEDIIIARTGTLGLVLTNIEGIFHNNTFALDYDRKILRKMFFYYYLQSLRVQQFIKIISSRTSQSDLTHREFSKLIVFIPPKNEQEKIENLISNISNLLEKKTEAKQYLENLKKGLMQQLLTGKIRVKV